MGQDLRNMFQEGFSDENIKLKEGHQFRFMDKLNEELPVEKKKEKNFFWLKIAAMIIVGVGMGVLTFSFLTNKSEKEILAESKLEQKETNFTIGSLSPELNKIEKYYIANINLQLTTLKFSKENKDLMDGYMMRLDELDIAYKTLTIELNEHGPNEHTISALIENLKLRLKLLFELKNKLNEIKTIENGKNTKSTI